MTGITVRFDETTVQAIKVAAAERGVSEAEMCRRLIRRQLSLDSGVDQIVVIQEAIRSVVRDELAPTRRLAFIAAFEAAAANAATIESLGDTLVRLPGAPADRRERVREVVHKVQQRARSVAAQRTRDPNPERVAEPDQETELPRADEAIELNPKDAALFEEEAR